MRGSSSNERTRTWLGFGFTAVSVFAVLLGIAVEVWWLIALGIVERSNRREVDVEVTRTIFGCCRCQTTRTVQSKRITCHSERSDEFLTPCAMVAG